VKTPTEIRNILLNINHTMSSPYCTICNNPATMRCSGCRCEPLYCSEPCQVADWKLHKILCKTRSSFKDPPTTSSRRAILFSTTGEITFIWVITEMKTDEDEPEVPWESPTGLEAYFGGKRPSTQIYHSNSVRGRKLKEIIDLKHNDTFLLDGSEKNLAVCRVVSGMDDGGTVWRAPLVALKHTRSYHDESRTFINSSSGYGHMDMGDLREVVDYLTSWKKSNDEQDVRLNLYK